MQARPLQAEIPSLTYICFLVLTHVVQGSACYSETGRYVVVHCLPTGGQTFQLNFVFFPAF